MTYIFMPLFILKLTLQVHQEDDDDDGDRCNSAKSASLAECKLT